MGTTLAQQTLSHAELSPKEIDELMILSTGGYPLLPELINQASGMTAETAHIAGSCASFGIGMDWIKQHEDRYMGKRIMILSPEIFTVLMDRKDINRPIFSDVGASTTGIYGEDFHIIDTQVTPYPGKQANALKVNPLYHCNTHAYPNVYQTTEQGIWAHYPPVTENEACFHMNGFDVMKWTKNVPTLIAEFLKQHPDIPPEQIKLVLHQANKRIVEKVIGNNLPEGLSPGTFYAADVGNSSASSTLMALNRESPTDYVLTASYGAGLAVSLALMKFFNHT
jgi:3-oxoacyl-[acyl-carrier-protein] synthase III